MVLCRPRSKVYTAVQVVLQSLVEINRRFVSSMQVALDLLPSHPAQRSFGYWDLRGRSFCCEYAELRKLV